MSQVGRISWRCHQLSDQGLGYPAALCTCRPRPCPSCGTAVPIHSTPEYHFAARGLVPYFTCSRSAEEPGG